jgi:hypothetical protein
VTTLVTDRLSISGGTWIAATVIVRIAAVLATSLLPSSG